MNKIFKVVFNAATGTWQAVSEAAKAKGKTKSSKTNKVAAVSLAVASAMTASSASAVTVSETWNGFEGNADASIYMSAGKDKTGAITGTSLGIQSGWTSTNDVAIGWNAQSLVARGVAIGGGAITNTTRSVAVGVGAKANPYSTLANVTKTDRGQAIAPATSTNNVVVGDATQVQGTEITAINAGNLVQGYRHIVIGRSQANYDGNAQLRAWGLPTQDHILIGNNITENSGLGSVAIGNDATVGGAAAAVSGDYAGTYFDPQATAIGGQSQAYAYSVAIGGNAIADQGGGSPDSWRTGTVAIGAYSHTDNANGGVAIGADSYVRGTQSNAIGVGTIASGWADYGTANGHEAKVLTGNATAVGSFARAGQWHNYNILQYTGVNVDAAGANPTTNAPTYATAVGALSGAISASSVAMGHNATAGGTSADVIARNTAAIATLTTEKTTAEAAVATAKATYLAKPTSATLQALNKAQQKVERIQQVIDTLTADNAATLASGATQASNSTAIGTNARANHVSALATGTDSKASGENSTAIGRLANATAQDSIAMGTNSTASNTNTTAIGHDAIANSTNATAVGPTAKGYGVNSVAMGWNAKANSTYTIAIGDTSNANNTAAIAMGLQSTADGVGAIAVGGGSRALNTNALAVGRGAVASGEASISIGTRNNVSGSFSGAIGDPSKIEGTNSYSLGNNNVIGASTDNAVVIGGQNNIGATGSRTNGIVDPNVALTTTGNATRSFVMGFNNTINAQETMILGNNVTATASNNVILGNNASESSVTTTNGVENAVNTATVSGYSYSGFAGDEVVQGIVSVGSQTATRQIINVAPGNISATSTDAINGSQLYLAMARTEATNNQYNVVSTDGSVTVTPDVTTHANGSTTTKFDLSVASVDTTDLTTAANGTITVPTGTDATAPASAASVANAVNGSFWNVNASGSAVGDGKVNPGNTVNFIGTNGITVAANTTGTDASTYNIDISVETANITNNGAVNANGTVTAPTSTTALATAADVAKAINNASFNVTSAADGGTVSGTQTAEQVKAGEVITFKSGKNLDIKQDGQNFTYATKENVSFTNITVGAPNADGTISNPITIANNAITGLTSTLPTTVNAGDTSTKDQAAPTLNATQLGSAATLGDVLNAGWNLQENGTAKDFVKPYDTVNFKNGTGTTVNITSDGNVSVVKFDVNTTTVNPANTDTAAADQVTINNAGAAIAPTDPAKANSFMTAGDVVTLVNGVSHNVTIGRDTAAFEDQAGVKAVPVKAGDTLTFKSGKNLKVKQDGQNFTYATEENVSFTNITVGAPTADGKPNANPITIANNAITGLNSTLPTTTNAGDTSTKGQAAPTLTPTQLTSAATLGDVLNAGWNLQAGDKAVDFVKPYDTVNFKGDGITITPSTDGNLSTLTFKVNTAGSQTNGNTDTADAADVTVNTKGKAVAPTGDAANNLVTASTLANVVNNVSYNVTIGRDDKAFADQDGKADTRVKAGDTLTFKSGKNLIVKQDGQNFTYATADNVSFTNVNANGTVTVGVPTDTQPAITIGKDGDKNVIAGLNSTLPSAAPATNNGVNNVTAPVATMDAPTVTAAQMGNAATLGDVLNAGFNLTENGTARDFVTPYNTLNFKDGNGTTAIVATDANGSVSNITFDVKKATFSATPSVPGTPDADNVTVDTTGKAAAPTGDAANNFLTAADTVNLVNSVSWTVTSAEDVGELSGTTAEKVQAGETVTFKAGKNMKLVQEGQNFTYATKENVSFTNITVGAPTADGKPNANPITIANNAITGLNSTLPTTTNAGDTSTKGQAAPTLTPTQLTSAATLGDVLNAGWNLQANDAAVDFVKPYDTVNFKAGNGITITPTTDGNVSTLVFNITTAQFNATAPSPDQTFITVNNTGKADIPAAKANQFMTAGDIVNLVNAVSHNVTIGRDDVAFTDQAGKVGAQVSAGDTITLNAGKNLIAKQNGTQITYATAENVNFTTVNVGTPDANGTIANPVKIADNAITGLNTTFAAPTTAATKPADVDTTKAATLGDVLNAGWNLQENGTAKDVVTPYDTVNFVDGKGTKVNITTTNANVSVVKVDVDTAKVSANTATGKAGTGDNGATTAPDANALVTAGDVINTINNTFWTVQGNGKDVDQVKAGDKVNFVNSSTINATVTPNADGTVTNVSFEIAKGTVTGNGTTANGTAGLVDGKQVADAINKSGWKATSGKTGTGEVSGTTTEVINPNETVKFIAGDNMKLVQEGNNFTYATKDDVTFKNVNTTTFSLGNATATNPTVNFVTAAGTATNVGTGANGTTTGTSTTPNAVNFASNNAPVQLTGVASTLNTKPVATTNANGTEPADVALVDLANATNPNSAATVADLQNMGWVVSAPANNYKQAVKNANEVKFTGTGGISVTGKTDANGAYNVTVAAAPTVNGNPAGNSLNFVNGNGTTATYNATTGGIAFNVNNTTGSVNSNGTVAVADSTAYLNAGEVAKLVNGSSFNVNSTATGTGKVVDGSTTTPTAVKAGDTVNINAGNNIEITRNGRDVTVATSMNPEFTTVTTNGLTVKPNSTVDMGGNRIQNVAPGVAPTDAVNVSQLTDLRDDLRAGIAGNTALSQIPQVTRPGANLVGVGVGHFRGESALAVGFSSASDNERVIFKLTGSANTQGDFNIGSGVGFQW